MQSLRLAVRSLLCLACRCLLTVHCVYSVMVSALEKGASRNDDQGFTWCCIYNVFTDAAQSAASSSTSPIHLASSRRSFDSNSAFLFQHASHVPVTHSIRALDHYRAPHIAATA